MAPKVERMKSISHHKEYFLVGGDLYILINTTMFRIHSYFFRREAKNFYSKLLDPTSPGEQKHGTSENTAIIVENATIQQFERFLWVFYNPLYDIYQADISDWFSILRLAHEWDFPNVKRFALREIRRREDEIELVKRIVLYQDYKAPAEYLVPLYAELCARPTSPTEGEAQLLGFERTLKIFRAREQVRSDGSISPLPKGKSPVDTYPTISSVLGLPTFVFDKDYEDTINVKTPKPTKNPNGRTSN
ncbi:hypothetical protein FA15DRAFT_297983 [Coprinopsis marcescibilis]|uniref:BTB domain-containing protein n=1 Tax=Coprinopsis marcescibilis TaxID=230819 RepID=A0A5C3L0V7_COPMA|nr:hypothetical protein FA15DRAFT_297983 [Coprinopsis marcescibilis]